MKRNWRADDIIEVLDLVEPEAEPRREANPGGPRAVSLVAEAEDQPGVLARVAGAVARLGVNIADCSVVRAGGRRGRILLALEVEDHSELERVRREVEGVEGVMAVGHVDGRPPKVGKVARTGVDHDGRTWVQLRTGQTIYPDATAYRNLTIEAEEMAV